MQAGRNPRVMVTCADRRRSTMATPRLQDALRAYTPTDPYGVKGEWIREDLLAMATPPPRRALSIGCGTGATEAVLRRSGAQVWGLDVSAEAVAIAAGRLDRAFVADIETDALSELEPGSFDLVLCGDVLEHLRFTEHALARIHGWLADGGHLVVAVPNAAHYYVVRELALRRNWRYEDGGLFDRGHYRLFTKTSLLRLLAEHGFAIDATAGTPATSSKLRFVRALLRPLLWLLPGLDEHFVYTWTVRARKVPNPTPKASTRAPQVGHGEDAPGPEPRG